MDQRDIIASSPTAREHSSHLENANTGKRGPIGEFLEHLLTELRQLDQRCSQLEILLHDFAILYATTTPDLPIHEDESCQQE